MSKSIISQNYVYIIKMFSYKICAIMKLIVYIDILMSIITKLNFTFECEIKQFGGNKE